MRDSLCQTLNVNFDITLEFERYEIALLAIKVRVYYMEGGSHGHLLE